jgi:hypothetical protein
MGEPIKNCKYMIRDYCNDDNHDYFIILKEIEMQITRILDPVKEILSPTEDEISEYKKWLSIL